MYKDNQVDDVDALPQLPILTPIRRAKHLNCVRHYPRPLFPLVPTYMEARRTVSMAYQDLWVLNELGSRLG